MIRPQKIILKGYSPQNTAGEVNIQDIPYSKRILAACITGIIGILFSAMTIVIPLLHFILPPLGMILTSILTYKAFQKSSLIVGGSGECPDCKKQIKIFTRGNRLPFNETCEHCYREIEVS